MSNNIKSNRSRNSSSSEKAGFSYLQIDFDRVELSESEKQSPDHARWACSFGYVEKPFRSSVSVEIISGMEAADLMEVFKVLYSAFTEGGGPWESVLKKRLRR